MMFRKKTDTNTDSVGRHTWKRVAVIISAGLVVASIAAYLVLRYYDDNSDSAKTASSQAATLKGLGAKKDSIELEALVSGYGKYYDAAIVELQESEPKKWSAEDVDKAHLCLIYADRAGDFMQSLSLSYMIEDAKSSGVSVDTNNLGMDDEYRAGILKRATDASSVKITDGE